MMICEASTTWQRPTREGTYEMSAKMKDVGFKETINTPICHHTHHSCHLFALITSFFRPSSALGQDKTSLIPSIENNDMRRKRRLGDIGVPCSSLCGLGWKYNCTVLPILACLRFTKHPHGDWKEGLTDCSYFTVLRMRPSSRSYRWKGGVDRL